MAEKRADSRSAAQGDTLKADIVLNARVSARVLRFNAEPQASLAVLGCPAIDTSRVSVRTNLPTPVKANVVYQNVIVDFRLRMSIAELDCLLADALARTGADSTAVSRPQHCVAVPR